MASINLLYKDNFKVNDKISVVIPTVGQILEDEDGYYGLVNILTAMPIDMMVQLDDAGIDFTKVNSYDLFILMFQGMKKSDTKLLFGDLDLSKFEIAVNQENGTIVLRDEENDITIDRAIHDKIARVLRKIHNLDQDRRKPANEEAKKFMLERARAKAKRHKPSPESRIEQLIVAMVNTEQYKYDFDSTRNLTIYQFNECVCQIKHKIDYEHRMAGVYAGTVSMKDLKQDELNWLVHK